MKAAWPAVAGAVDGAKPKAAGRNGGATKHAVFGQPRFPACRTVQAVERAESSGSPTWQRIPA